MRSPYIEIWLYGRPDRSITIEQRHARFVERMQRIGPPLGYQGLEPPSTPDCRDALSAFFSMRYPIKGLKCFGDYTFRGQRYVWEDHPIYDEHLRFRFSMSNKFIDYQYVITNHLHLVVEAFEAYRSKVKYGSYSFEYTGGLCNKNPTFNKLNEDSSNGADGRNNIYTLYPAQFWDGELCRRASGFDRDEVIRRLKDVAVVVRPVLDGVYLVLNDDPNLTYEAYVEMNERIKPMLGLHYGPPIAGAAIGGSEE